MPSLKIDCGVLVSATDDDKSGLLSMEFQIGILGHRTQGTSTYCIYQAIHKYRLLNFCILDHLLLINTKSMLPPLLWSELGLTPPSADIIYGWPLPDTLGARYFKSTNDLGMKISIHKGARGLYISNCHFTFHR